MENNIVIGLDFGNFYSQPCYIKGMDPVTRMGGICRDLQDTSAVDPNGIPSAFFYCSKKFSAQPVVGYRAADAKPFGNCIRYLKQHLKPGETIQLDDRTFKYEDMIVEVIQYCVRMANEQLMAKEHVTTNKISLSYPAEFWPTERLRLVELAQRATTEDGRHVEVVGTAAEPAAAALHYLAGTSVTKETTVLAYDMGAGTFDISLVKAYPQGKKSGEKTYYYDVRDTKGSSQWAGHAFDKKLFELFVKKGGEDPTGASRDRYIKEAEVTKRKLSKMDEYEPNLGDVEITVTRKEFETLATPLVQETINMVKNMLNNPSNPKPDIILLTGGSSRMPIVMEMMKKAFPRHRIEMHDPSQAIAFGVARFGVIESEGTNAAEAIIQRVPKDIGVRYVNGAEDKKGHIKTFIPAGTPIPFTSEGVSSYTVLEGQYSDFSVFESKGQNPDANEVARDYNKIMDNSYDHGRIVPVDTESVTRLIIDKNGLLHIEVRDPKDPNKKPYKNNTKMYF